MKRGISLIAAAWLAAFPASGETPRQMTAQTAILAPTTYEIAVPAATGAYRTTAWVLPIGQMTIYGLDPDDGGAGKLKLPFAYDVADIARMRPRATVINGGFSGSEPSQAAGLLLIGGRVVNPLARTRYPDGRYRLSAILCQSPSGTVSLLRTADVANARESLLSRCASAIQAGPFVVENGRNGIGSAELGGSPHIRTMIGLDAAGRPYVVVFTRPIHLFAAATFLSTPRGQDAGGTAALTRTQSGLRASSGLGLSMVMNLDGDTSTALVHRGQRIVGDPSRPRPSAILID